MSLPGTARLRAALAAVAACAAIGAISPGAAGAATVVNGDFETGTLAGWSQYPDLSELDGRWQARNASMPAPTDEIDYFPPAQGAWNGATIQDGPGTRILFQDIVLEPGYTQQLSMLVYYKSAEPLVTPVPNTLSAFDEGDPPNQQYRIDVIRPAAPIDSLAPADVLTTLFATATGDPQTMAPTQVTGDLSAFAGQTVRLRLVEVDNRGFLFAQVDAVEIVSVPPPPPPSNQFTFGKLTRKAKNGTARLSVTLPGAGSVQIADVKAKKKRIKAKTVAVATAGAINLPLQPTGFGRRKLKSAGKLTVKVAVTFTPAGGTAATQTKKVVLKLKPPKKARGA